MASEMVKNGRVLNGTPLSRLVSALDGSSELASVLAGDVLDVCKACDPADEVVAQLAGQAKVRPGTMLFLDAAELSHVVELLTVPAAAQEADEAEEALEGEQSKPAPKKKRKPKKEEERQDDAQGDQASDQHQ